MFRDYYECGVVAFEAIFNLGRQKATYFYSSGTKKIEGYISGVPFLQIGTWTEWYENGVIKSISNFGDPEINGIIANTKHGRFQTYDANGDILTNELYQNGQLIGE